MADEVKPYTTLAEIDGIRPSRGSPQVVCAGDIFDRLLATARAGLADSALETLVAEVKEVRIRKGTLATYVTVTKRDGGQDDFEGDTLREAVDAARGSATPAHQVEEDPR